MTNAVIPARVDPKEQYERIETALADYEAQIVSTLAKGIDPKRWLAVALQSITRSSRLLQCTPASIVLALRDAAELGLEPSGLLRSAYLVPYKNRKSNRYEAKLIPGYSGLISIARRSGEVRTIEGHVVRERDEFDYAYGTDKFLHHKPYANITGEKDENGKLLTPGEYIYAYAIAVLSTGETQFDVMTIPEISAIRARSKAADDGPWVTDWSEMARKTPTRRLFKYLPIGYAPLQRALQLEDEAEGDAVESGATGTARAALNEALHLDTDEGEDEGEANTAAASNAAETDGGQPGD